MQNVYFWENKFGQGFTVHVYNVMFWMKSDLFLHKHLRGLQILYK